MKLLTTIVASGLVLAAASGDALAGLQTNGKQYNGIQLNGIQLNGIQLNGIQLNGIQLNGIQLNGIQLNGIQLNGNNLSASIIALNSSCVHREDVTGVALPASCSTCAKVVVAADPYCANNQWDSLCVSGANSLCKFEGNELAGQVATASFDDGSWAKIRIDGADQGASAYWNGTQYLDMRDTYYYRLSYTCSHAATAGGQPLAADCSSAVQYVCTYDSYCCTNWWDDQCVAEANTWTTAQSKGAGGAVCSTNPGTGKGVFVPGRWNYSSGAQGNGGKSSSTGMTFACENVGAIAKCVNMGYKPWKSSSLNTLHQSCVRMVRADFCGDGVSWTKDGTEIDVKDRLGLESNTGYNGSLMWIWEATWGPNGARYINDYLLNYSRYRGVVGEGKVSDYELNVYRNTHPYCQTNMTPVASAPALTTTYPIEEGIRYRFYLE
jgi:hypothetical protein